MHLYLKRGLLLGTSLVFITSVGLCWKGAPLAKHLVTSALTKSLAPLGIQEVQIDSVSLGWGRVYLRDIQSKPSPSHASLTVQEIDIALSPFLKMKAIDITGATLNLTETGMNSYSLTEWQQRHTKAVEGIRHLKTLKLPQVAIRDSSVVIPTHKGSLTLPVQMVTQNTVTKNQIMTLDFGEQGIDKFFGQVILDSSSQGLSIDIHTANIDLETPHFQLSAPEISVYCSSATGEEEGYVVEGFARLNALKLQHFGSLLTPIEANLEGTGLPDKFTVDQFDITSMGGKGREASLELTGEFKPFEGAAELSIGMNVAKLDQFWDFTPLFAKPTKLEGHISAKGDLIWTLGKVTAPTFTIIIQHGALRREKFVLNDVNTRMTLSGLYPLVTKGFQKINLNQVVSKGTALKNVIISCAFDQKGDLQIQEVAASGFGGTFKAHDFKKKPGELVYAFETDLHNVEMTELLKLSDLKTIAGRAKLEGTLAMTYGSESGLDLNRITVHSTPEGGVFQYRPQGLFSESKSLTKNITDMEPTEMIFQILDDLHFNTLNIDIASDKNDPTEWGGIIKIAGFNPNVLNSYPFEFNITPSGKLKDLVVNTIKNMKTPKSVKKLGVKK